MQRRDLWSTICNLSTCGLPWIVAGEFNTVRWTHEKHGGAAPRARGLIEFNDCLHDAGLLDMKLTGPLFTWFNSSVGDSRIECKLDRVLINANFLHSNPFQGEILMLVLSDHSPILLSLHEKPHIKSLFRYYNFWAKMPGFFQIVKDVWDMDISGTPLFIVVRKLSLLKKRLIEWKKL